MVAKVQPSSGGRLELEEGATDDYGGQQTAKQRRHQWFCRRWKKMREKGREGSELGNKRGREEKLGEVDDVGGLVECGGGVRTVMVDMVVTGADGDDDGQRCVSVELGGGSAVVADSGGGGYGVSGGFRRWWQNLMHSPRPVKNFFLRNQVTIAL
ncbi:hypothetical protein PIB30_044806 [Stylosanthes scabra]|uniref:Uncharacterized protein n=1 Tax=Stylosanthes scabra TaxID=79078 RepID=A0ABU6UG63_9FABA|nr:hypothetical protein [Stylosanthes scabra]